MDTKVELKKKMVEVVANEVDVSTFGIRITQGSSPAGAEICRAERICLGRFSESFARTQIGRVK